MTLKPLQLRRRRWTLVFTFPFTLFMAAVGLYSVFLLLTGADGLLAIFAACGAFVAFCVGGTIGKSALEALFDKSPAVVIDSSGLNDLRSGELVSWEAVGEVKLDLDEQRILVNFDANGTSGGKLMSNARKLLSGADHTIALSGLSYRPRELQQSLNQFHRQARLLSNRNPAPSDA